MKKSKSYRPASAGNKKFAKKRLYDNVTWTEYSIRFLSHNPKCYACGERARVVDHVIAAKGDVVKFWEVTNLIPLCLSDHNTITALFDRHVVPKTEEKMKWIQAKRIEKDVSVRVKIVPKEN